MTLETRWDSLCEGTTKAKSAQFDFDSKLNNVQLTLFWVSVFLICVFGFQIFDYWEAELYLKKITMSYSISTMNEAIRENKDMVFFQQIHAGGSFL